MDVERLEKLTKKAGGRFRLTALLQKRLAELVRGSPAMVDLASNNYFEIALSEIEEGKVRLLAPGEQEEAAQLEAPEQEKVEE